MRDAERDLQRNTIVLRRLCGFPPGQSRPVIPSIPSLIVGNDRTAFDKCLIGRNFGVLFSIRGLQVSPLDSVISGENRF